MLVSDTGATPLTASNGRECIDIITKNPVDMIFMDRHMPVMDGLEATREIRSLPTGKSIPIIGISASEDESERDQCLQAGMNLVVNKLTLNYEKICEIAELVIYNSNSHTDAAITHNYSETHQDCEILNADDEVMDYLKALREFENDKELLNSLMENFLKNSRTQLDLMKNSFDHKDFESIQRESHGIKGGAANLCAMSLSDAAKALEMACKNHLDADTIFQLLNDLNRAVESFGKYVKNKLFS
jgi:CheY-like chemotaxis protein